jgi:alpha-glucosidase (family GH31 glycosyl hydrolase)
LQVLDRVAELHPALADPPPGQWDEGPPLDPGWRDLPPDAHLEVAATDDGVLRIEAHVSGAGAVGARFGRDEGEFFVGFGVRSDQVVRTEGVVENWVGEGPYQLDEYPLVEALTPRWAIRRRRDAAYYPVPWCLSSAGYGVLVDNPQISWFRFGGEVSVEVRADRLRLRLFKGETTAELLERFTAATGRQPYPVAPWFLGPWCQTGHADLVELETEKRIIATLRDADAPISAVETHMRRLPGGAHEGRRDAEKARTTMFHEHGLASLTYLNPFVSEDYAKRFGRAEPLLQRRGDGSPYLYPAYIGGREPPITSEGQLDFAAAGAADLFAELAREAVEDGHDGWMEDFGEYTPPDAFCADGSAGGDAHNSYPVLFHAAGAAAVPGAARMVRSGWTGAASHAPLVWGGDPTTGWGFDGLASAVTQGLSAGLSGVAFWGSDIGGFFTLGQQELDAELLIRWIQFGALSPLMRTKAEGIAIPPRRRPQVWDPDILPHWRRWAKFHTQLSPYLLAAAREYVETGMPLMRHMCLVDPASRKSDQYLLGRDLLVAPVLEPGTAERTLDLPAGRWVDLWRSASYNELTGGLIAGSPRIHEGPATVTVPAPLDEIPVLMRLGAEIRLLAPDVWSLAAPHDRSTPSVLSFPNS